MPGLDGTGPGGKGSKTGRGLGNCNDTQPQGHKTQSDKRRLGERLRKRLGINWKNRGGMKNRQRHASGNNNTQSQKD